MELLLNKSQNLINEKYNEKSNDITKISAKLKSLNPLSILSRGYSIAEKRRQCNHIKLTAKQG